MICSAQLKMLTRVAGRRPRDQLGLGIVVKGIRGDDVAYDAYKAGLTTTRPRRKEMLTGPN